MENSVRDKWMQWLLERRHGGNVEQRKAMLETLSGVRDRVLENSALAPGETVLDVGCGDGLIAFGALPVVGESGQVHLSRASAPLLWLRRVSCHPSQAKNPGRLPLLSTRQRSD